MDLNETCLDVASEWLDDTLEEIDYEYDHVRETFESYAARAVD